MTIVKICGLTDATAVRAALDAGADAIGFVFADSVRRISPADARKLAIDIPPDVTKVAVMKNPSHAEWEEVFEVFQPDAIQTDLVDIALLEISHSVRTWPVVREKIDKLKRKIPGCFVYEGPKSGSGQTVDWEVAAHMTRHGHMILAGGLSPVNVAEAIQVVQPYGVDVSSGVEAKPGKKDPDKIRDFISAVRKADSEKEISK